MAEYINRYEVLLKVQDKLYNTVTAAKYAEIEKTILKIPTADVEEIVRCKDCVNRKTENCAMYYRCNCGEQHTWENDNNFCSYGERKESYDKNHN